MRVDPALTKNSAASTELQESLSDLELVENTRLGDTAAFAELWKRHSRAGKTVAKSYSADAEDIVSESFAKILQTIRNGGGPTAAFRPYLFSTIRHVAMQWKKGNTSDNSDELDALADPRSEETHALHALDQSLTVQAFRSLPTRWQEALWYSEVEQLSSQEIAPLLGMKANAVSALTFRAREGLRQAWIQAHLLRTASTECGSIIHSLGAYARDSLGVREKAKIDAHLENCASCAIVAEEAKHVGSRLSLVLLPLVAGVAGAAAYTVWLQNPGTAAAESLPLSQAIHQMGNVKASSPMHHHASGTTVSAKTAGLAASLSAHPVLVTAIGVTLAVAAAGASVFLVGPQFLFQNTVPSQSDNTAQIEKELTRPETAKVAYSQKINENVPKSVVLPLEPGRLLIPQPAVEMTAEEPAPPPQPEPVPSDGRGHRGHRPPPPKDPPPFNPRKVEIPTINYEFDPAELVFPNVTGKAEPGAWIDLLDPQGKIVAQGTSDVWTGEYWITDLAFIEFGTTELRARQRTNDGAISPLSEPTSVTLRKLTLFSPQQHDVFGSRGYVVRAEGEAGACLQYLIDDEDLENKHYEFNSDGVFTEDFLIPETRPAGWMKIGIRYYDAASGRYGQTVAVEVMVK